MSKLFAAGVLHPSSDDDQGTDYVLEEGASSCWITVDNISVYVLRTKEGVVVELYPLELEMDDCMDSCWAMFKQAQELIDDSE